MKRRDVMSGYTKILKRKIADIPRFTPDEIKAIRINSNLTQDEFASCIGVSRRAVESWESGRTVPPGTARRIIGLMKNNPNFAVENELIS